jgi:hypothetical protein
MGVCTISHTTPLLLTFTGWGIALGVLIDQVENTPMFFDLIWIQE